jgi:hypothetical protein
MSSDGTVVTNGLGALWLLHAIRKRNGGEDQGQLHVRFFAALKVYQKFT